MTDTPMSRALRFALGLFDGRAVDLEEIERNCDSVLQMLGARNDELPDRDELVKEVESRVVVWQSASVSLDDLTGHQEWLADRRPISLGISGIGTAVTWRASKCFPQPSSEGWMKRRTECLVA